MNRKDILTIAALALVGLGLVLHALLPRYEWRVIGEDGTVIVVYDRWSNYLQRAIYDRDGHVKPNEPFKPF
jgi:hypothetical protein